MTLLNLSHDLLVVLQLAQSEVLNKDIIKASHLEACILSCQLTSEDLAAEDCLFLLASSDVEYLQYLCGPFDLLLLALPALLAFGQLDVVSQVSNIVCELVDEFVETHQDAC